LYNQRESSARGRFAARRTGSVSPSFGLCINYRNRRLLRYAARRASREFQLALDGEQRPSGVSSLGLEDENRRVKRRLFLGALGGLGALGVGPSVASGTEASCVLTPAQTEGPFFLETDLMRSDIRDGKSGTALALDLRVLRADGCSPFAGAFIEIWHADAAGNYSGFGKAEGNGANAGDRRFLRGFQKTDADGRARFQTVFPGWYPGRAPHVHLMVRASRDSLLTTQLYFPETVSDRVYATPPYGGRGSRRTTNAADGAEEQALVGKVSATGDGYTTVFRMVVPG
jgi:protocatechuate 3,4-dioxygenase beta subunit